MSENSFGGDVFGVIHGDGPEIVEIDVYNELELSLASPLASPASTLENSNNSSVFDNLMLVSPVTTTNTDSIGISSSVSNSNDSTNDSTSYNETPTFLASTAGESRWSVNSVVSSSSVTASPQSATSSLMRVITADSSLDSPSTAFSEMNVPSPLSISSDSTIDYVDIVSDNLLDSIDMESDAEDYDSDTLTEPFEYDDTEENEIDNDEVEIIEPNDDIEDSVSDQLEDSVDDEYAGSIDDIDEDPPAENIDTLVQSYLEQATSTAGENLTVTGEEEVKTSSSEQKASAPSTCGVKRPAESDEADDEDGQTCMICMDVWSNSGDHRLSSLKCGHLFGHSCIVRWLLLAKNKLARRCPQCNLIASIRDVRILYAKKLMAIDTVEKDVIKKKLEEAVRERNKLELDLKKSELTTQLQAKQLLDLQTRLAASTTVGRQDSIPGKSSALQSSNGTEKVNLVNEHFVEICKDGGCRILAYKESLNLLVASQRSANALFSGYGISKMNSLDFRPTQFIFLHTKPIRDLAFHTSDNDLLLSVSLDKCAKLMDITSNGVVQNFQTDTSLWSCCWDADNSNIFFVGGQDGSVIQYDIRKTGSPLCRISRGANVRSVTSIAAMPSRSGGALPRGGFVACHLNSCWAYEQIDSEYVGKELPLDGPFFSMRYDRETDHILASMRPSQRSIRARHVVCELDRSKITSSLTCNEIHTLYGSLTQSVLSRPCQMRIAGYGSVVASHEESGSCMAVWSLANGNKVCSHPVTEAILDTCAINVNQKQFLGAVSDKTLRVYRVVHH